MTNTIREIESQNVIAKIEGSDPQLRDEYVVYMAHGTISVEMRHSKETRSSTVHWTMPVELQGFSRSRGLSKLNQRRAGRCCSLR